MPSTEKRYYPMKLSIIIPAYNEAETITQCVGAAKESCEQANLEDFEILVVDDDSTDDTAELAQQAGAQVVRSGKRNIGATRNMGAKEAKYEYLIFVDADTYINSKLLNATVNAFEKGVIGGGARLRWSEKVSYSSEFLVRLWNLVARIFFFPAGSYFFVKKEIFDQVGGFDEQYYATEEIYLAKAIKQLGKVKILREKYKTSPRKIKQFTFKEHWAFIRQFIRKPHDTVTNRENLDLWYTRRDS